MTFAFVLSVASAVAGIGLGLLAGLVGRAPGWERDRPFALVALTAGLAALANAPSTTPVPDAAVPWFARVQLAALCLHVAAWLRYAAVRFAAPARGAGAALGALALAAAAGTLVPGAVFGAGVHRHAVPALGLVYLDAAPEPGVYGVAAVLLAGWGAVALRFFRAARAGPAQRLPLAALVLLPVAGLHDLAVTSGLLATPYLLDLALVAPIAAVTFGSVRRLAADARDLAELRRRLEAMVEDRTRDLRRAQEALHREEQLGAVGRLAAGVAHEVASPASAVLSSAAFLEEWLAETQAPVEVREAARDAREAAARIGELARSLHDAGRAASGAPEARAAVSLAAVAEAAVAAARARHGLRAKLADLVPGSAFALGQERLLVQIVRQLVQNALEAIPLGRGGQVVVRAERDGGRVRLLVEDDGEGLDPEGARRAFEPFFTTRGTVGGRGLGLAVARGLARALGGELTLAPREGGGTRAALELDAAEPPAPGPGAGPGT